MPPELNEGNWVKNERGISYKILDQPNISKFGKGTGVGPEFKKLLLF